MDNDFDDEFKALCESYGKKLPEKIADIKNSFQQLRNSWDMKNLMEFSSLIHKLNGSAGMYGYKEISKKSGEIEKRISRYDHDIAADKQSLDEIENVLAEIAHSIETSAVETIPLLINDVNTNLVFLLTDNKSDSVENSWSKNLVDQAIIFGYTLKTFVDIEPMFEELKNNRPIALLINFEMLSNPFMVNLSDANVQDIINMYFKKIYTIFIANSGELEKRLKAVRLGCKSYLIKPFGTDELIAELDNLKYTWSSKFKAIIIDDDPEILKHHSNILSSANIENRTVSSYKNIESELHDFQPDIILLDLNMPECSGVEVASIIRQQKSYEDIPIVFLSTEENKNIQLQAMSVGADDFITKASDPNHLIQSIRIKASRYKKIKSIISKDNLTGVFNFRYMSREIEKQIADYKKTSKQFSICVTQVDNLMTVKNSYGYNASDQLLSGLAILLSNQLDSSRVIGLCTPERFLIIFPNTNSDTARIEMKSIQEKFISTLQYAEGKAYSSSFHMGLSDYEDGYSIEQLIKAAEPNK